MNEIRDDFDESEILIEKSKNENVLAFLHFPFVKADVMNGNGRTYSSELMKKEISKKNEEIKKSGVAGQLSHPIGSSSTELTKVSHVLTDLSYSEDTKIGDARTAILATTSGRDLLTLLKSGLKLGASMRGRGTVDAKGKVNNDYQLDSIDIVANPSFGKDVEISSQNLVFESGNAQLAKENQENEKTLREIYQYVLEEGSFSGSYEQFLQEFDLSLLDIAKITETAESKLVAGVKKKMSLLENFDEAVESGYRGTLKEYERLVSGENEQLKIKEEDALLKHEYRGLVEDGMVTESFENWLKSRKK